MEQYFSLFRKNIIGINQTFLNPEGKELPVIYTDWIASGRMYGPIEQHLMDHIYPFVANTHTETNTTGSYMTLAYHKALNLIKNHVGANAGDAIISSNSGMTGVVNKLQRILGLKIHEKHRNRLSVSENDRPIVFITHMEHHSNQTTWLETLADVEIIPPTPEGLVDLNAFQVLLEKYAHRTQKIAAVTSCSNVTGIFTPYYKIAGMIHRAGGLCFVDFACSAPYVDINMHPAEEEEYLDAVYFSPHKFLGGPGTTGILIFNKALYTNEIPDNPGGGTVDWTNPWGDHKYIDDIEAREDGGTPAFIQTIKVALCIQLKEQMGVKNILKREKEQLAYVWGKLSNIANLHILAPNIQDRLSVISFYIDGLHYNLGVKALNDRFGIQVRGGCSCAGTYGHYLLHVSPEQSKKITSLIDSGDYSEKPGWIRLSIHPTTTNQELEIVCDAIQQLAENHEVWAKNYTFDKKHNALCHHSKTDQLQAQKAVNEWFSVDFSAK